MSKPLATVKLTLRFALFEDGKGIALCESGVERFFAIEGAKKLWLTLHSRPGKNRVEVNRRTEPVEIYGIFGGHVIAGRWYAGDERTDFVSHTREYLDRLAKKHNRTVFYVECEYE